MPVCHACLSSRQPIRRLRPSDPLELLRPSFLQPLASDIAGYLKLATVGELRIERFRLGQAVAGIPIEATLEGLRSADGFPE